jgi:arabinofuranosyltransferase
VTAGRALETMRRPRWSWLVLGIGAAWALVASVHALRPELPVDDAYISFAYAKNLAHWHGFVMTPNAATVEGFSNFLWVVLLAGAERVGLTAPTAALLASAAATALLVPATAWATRQIRPGLPVAAGLGAGLLVASLPATAFHATSGLETSLTALLVVSAVGLFLASPDSVRRTVLAPAVGVGVALVRPEGVVIVAALLVLHPAPWRQRKGDLLCVGAIAAFELFRVITFGSLVPNTVRAKSLPSVWATLHAGWHYLAVSSRPYLPLLPLAVAGAVVGGRRARGAISVIVLTTGVVIFSPGEGYAYGRYLFPAIVLTIALAAGGASWTIERLRTRPRLTTALAATLAVVLVGSCIDRAFAPGQTIETDRLFRNPLAGAWGRLVSTDRNPHRGVAVPPYHEMTAWLRPRVRPGEVVAAQEVGIISYYSGLDVIDTFGLADRRIAGRPGLPSGRYDPDYVFGRRPDWWVLRLNNEASRHPGLLADAQYAGDARFAASYELVHFSPSPSLALAAVFRRRAGLTSTTELFGVAPPSDRTAAAAPASVQRQMEAADQPSAALARVFYRSYLQGWSAGPVTISVDLPAGRPVIEVLPGPGAPAGRFQIDVLAPTARPVTVADLTLEDTAWQPRELDGDLGRWAGQTVTLRFTYSGQGSGLVWAEPTLLEFGR